MPLFLEEEEQSTDSLRMRFLFFTFPPSGKRTVGYYTPEHSRAAYIQSAGEGFPLKFRGRPQRSVRAHNFLRRDLLDGVALMAVESGVP